ncbi:protein QUIRKY-like [Gossypium australe]|uniref:Protein QUIRKY-like n=1 Tax=Gossypium australe TaxID=47621 RepID=A0A5B6WJN5_9ROSI|nr:protein QUIRKY-like [Gossypium australe]
MRELRLAIRFTCSSYLNLFLVCTMNPLLPHMHHIYPLSIYQLAILRKQVVRILCSSPCWTEPPLRQEVVEYMLDGGSQMWSLRKAKAIFRLFYPSNLKKFNIYKNDSGSKTFTKMT